MIDFAYLADKAKSIGAVVACCVTVAGTVVGGWAYFEMPLVATRNYVSSKTDTLRTQVIDNRMQTNNVQRQLLRKEKFDRDLEIKRATSDSVRSILRDRLDRITEEIAELEEERERLKRERDAK